MKLRNVVISLLVSVVCLYFVLRNVQWSEVWNHLSQVNLGLFGLSMLLMLAAYFLMAWRWQHLLDPLEVPGPSVNGKSDTASSSPTGVRHHAGITRLYGMMMTGYFFNSFFPARAGDLVRAYLLGRSTGLRKTTVLATVVIEKAFDGIALLLMLLLSLVLLPSSRGAGTLCFDPGGLAIVAGLALVAVIVGLALFYMHNARIAMLVESIFGWLPLPEKLQRLAVRLVETF